VIWLDTQASERKFLVHTKNEPKPHFNVKISYYLHQCVKTSYFQDITCFTSW